MHVRQGLMKLRNPMVYACSVLVMITKYFIVQVFLSCHGGICSFIQEFTSSTAGLRDTIRWRLGYPIPFCATLYYLQNDRVDFVVTPNLASHISVSSLQWTYVFASKATLGRMVSVQCIM